ncbi:MAG: thioredoxin family protein [Acetobacteraceae bacterium]
MTDRCASLGLNTEATACEQFASQGRLWTTLCGGARLLQQPMEEDPMRLTHALAAGLVACALATGAADAATTAPFTQAAFRAAQAEGRPIVVDIYASWCPTCAQQHKVITRLERDPAFADLMIYKVNIDTQKPVMREFGARMRSTLIAFHGKTEEARSIGATAPAAIKALMEKALG